MITCEAYNLIQIPKLSEGLGFPSAPNQSWLNVGSGTLLYNYQIIAELNYKGTSSHQLLLQTLYHL